MKIGIFLLPIFIWCDVCIYTPPNDWQPSKPKDLSRAEIGFVQKGSGLFNTSINLVKEGVDCGLVEYVKAVKAVHLAQPNTRFTDLGKIEMRAGVGRLLEVRRSSPFGDLVLLQGIYLEKGVAYILTAASLKKDFPTVQKEIIESMRSLNVLPDLWSAAQNGEELESIAEWKTFEKTVEKQPLGKYWQYLALQEGKKRIDGN